MSWDTLRDVAIVVNSRREEGGEAAEGGAVARVATTPSTVGAVGEGALVPDRSSSTNPADSPSDGGAGGVRYLCRLSERWSLNRQRMWVKVVPPEG